MSNPPVAPINDRIRPSATSPRGSFLATVLQNLCLCTDHYRLILSLPHFPPSSPGQFIQLDCRENSADDSPPPPLPAPSIGPRHPIPRPTTHPTPSPTPIFAPLAYLRRPFSIADRRDLPTHTEIDIIHRVVGKGTHHLKQLQPGMTISLLGPLGIGFQIPNTLQLACLVGGGVGIPPMIYLAQRLALQKIPAVAFIGAQRRDLLPVTILPDAPAPSPDAAPLLNIAEFQSLAIPSIITTDDGSSGMKGFITQALTRFLQTTPAPANSLICCCGPTPMMKATANVAHQFHIPCQLSLEQPMACGMGTCQSCIIRYRPHNDPSITDWKYKLTCTDGPVFDSRDILW